MKKYFLAASILLLSLQPMTSSAAERNPNLPYKNHVFTTVQNMEEQCIAAYTNFVSQSNSRAKLSFLKASSKRNKNEIEVIVEFAKSDTQGSVKYRCVFIKGSLSNESLIP